MTMPGEPRFYTLRYSRRHLRRRRHRRLAVALLGLGVAIAVASWAVPGSAPGERMENAAAIAASAVSDDDASLMPREETLDLDRDQPGADAAAGSVHEATNGDVAGLGSSLANAEPVAQAGVTPSERTRPRLIRASAVPPHRLAGTARIEIAAAGSAAAGHRLWRRLREKNADILHGLDATVEREASSVHAAVYRVEIGPIVQASARRTCDALQRRDVSCLVLRKATG